MTTTTMTLPSQSIYNVPNAITSVRFVLSIAVIVLIPLQAYWAALWLFVVAASTDWMDGYWARKYNQVTKVGRIFDPLVDKIIVCGTFVALVGIAESGVAAWMATVIIARELLVTSLRGMIEGSGGDFSANQLGKWKMVFQCAAVVAILLAVIYPSTIGLAFVASALLWMTIAITVYSGYVYVIAAARLIGDDDSAARQSSN